MESKIVVVDASDAPVGFMVDEVTEVVHISKGEVEDVPGHIASKIEAEYVVGIAKRDEAHSHFPIHRMKLGTPLSPSATRVMLLGAGELGKEVIIALQRLGVEVIAVDRYASAPGQQVAHRAHVINMADPQALRTLIEQERPHLVVLEIEAIATDELVNIEREGLTVVIPTARAARLTMNREGIRRLAAEELGLRTSAYASASSLDEMRAVIDSGIGYPCVVKPVMSSSGKGHVAFAGKTYTSVILGKPLFTRRTGA